jgi:hypothetical protein
MKTKNISVTRGSSFVLNMLSLDENQQKRNLTGAKIYMVISPDLKATAPLVKLTTETLLGWRTAIVILDQNQYPGEYVVTGVPDDTSSLVALGHDNPWQYDIKIDVGGGVVIQDVDQSDFDLYPQITDVP